MVGTLRLITDALIHLESSFPLCLDQLKPALVTDVYTRDGLL